MSASKKEYQCPNRIFIILYVYTYEGIYVISQRGAGSRSGTGQISTSPSLPPPPTLQSRENPYLNPVKANFSRQNRGGFGWIPVGSGFVGMPSALVSCDFEEQRVLAGGCD